MTSGSHDSARIACVGTLRRVSGGDSPGRRFPWAKDGLGSPKAFAIVGEGKITLDHPLLKRRLVVPLGQVRACAEVVEIAPVDRPLRREPRRVDFVGPMVDATLVLLVSPAVRLDQLAYGAEKRLAVTPGERKRGVDVDLIGLFPASPGDLARALEGAGATRYLAVQDMLRLEIGEASSVEAEAIVQERRRRRRTAGRRLLALGCVVAAFMGALLNGPDPEVSIGSLVASAVVALPSAVAFGFMMTRMWPELREARPARQAADVGRRSARLVGELTAMITLTFALPWLGRNGVVPGVVGSGAAGGLMGSPVVAFAFHLLGRPRA